MNLDEVTTLSDDELRIKVAGLMGMQNIRRGYNNNDAYLNLGGVTQPPVKDMGLSYRLVGDIVSNDGAHNTFYIEDYPNDIAAAWRLESNLKSVDRQDEYIHCLSEITLQIAWPNKHSEQWPLIHASPRARTRAFVLAMENNR